MFRVGNLVRSRLNVEPQARAGRIRRLIQEVRSLMGSEARHLRRLGICLHGLQMVGSRGVPAGGDAEPWLMELLDEIHLLAGTAQEPCEMEHGWEQEVKQRRVHLIESHCLPQALLHQERQSDFVTLKAASFIP